MEGDLAWAHIGTATQNFYPRPPGGGRQGFNTRKAGANNFYPRPPGGGRPCDCKRTLLPVDFYPRPPGGGRREAWRKFCCSSPNFYPRPPDGGRSHFSPWKIGYECISIHALRVEGDAKLGVSFAVHRPISIHALRVEGDPWAKIRHTHKITISIHALRVEGDVPFGANSYLFILFLSTPSGWRATSAQCAARLLRTISIHALRVEGDILRLLLSFCTAYFYPRPPGGGRLPAPNSKTA